MYFFNIACFLISLISMVYIYYTPPWWGRTLGLTFAVIGIAGSMASITLRFFGQ